jgi:putative oxidoreductase
MKSKNIGVIRTFMQTRAPTGVILIRFLTGAVFFLEGIKKFLFPDDWGVGRFVKIGIPSPEVLAPFVGAVEIVCGFLVLWGLFTRLASIPLIIVITVAIATTKIPILLNSGFWPMEDHARTDYSMLMGLLFLLIVGSGKWSIDALLSNPKT